MGRFDNTFDEAWDCNVAGWRGIIGFPYEFKFAFDRDTVRYSTATSEVWTADVSKTGRYGVAPS